MFFQHVDFTAHFDAHTVEISTVSPSLDPSTTRGPDLTVWPTRKAPTVHDLTKRAIRRRFDGLRSVGEVPVGQGGGFHRGTPSAGVVWPSGGREWWWYRGNHQGSKGLHWVGPGVGGGAG